MTHIQSVNHLSPNMPDKNQALREAAEKLEAGFLAEMLESAGLGKTSSYFGGGAGEDQFASFLIEEQAMQIVKSGGLGLTESLFHALRDNADE